MLRFLRYIVEILAAFVGIVAILSLLLAWRLNAKPVTSDFLTPYIEAGIEGIVPGSDVKIGSTMLTWDNVDHLISVQADTIAINNAQSFRIATIPSLHASISVVGLLFGQFMPEELSVDHPQISLVRDSNGSFVFGGMKMGAETNDEPKSAESIKDALHNTFEHISKAILMHRLAVTDAAVDVHDISAHKDWALHIPEISIKRIGLREISDQMPFGSLEGRMIFEITQKDGDASLDVHYTYDPQTEQHKLSTVLSGLNPAFLAGGHPEALGLSAAAIVDLPLTGKAEVGLDKDFSIENASVQIHGDSGRLVYADFWDNPCPVRSFAANASYDRDSNSLSVSDTHIDLNGSTLNLGITGGAPSQKGQDMDFSMSLQLDNLPMNNYKNIWPKPVIADAREWLVANLHDGTFAHAEATLKGSLAWNDLGNLSITEGNGKAQAIGATVNYLEGMPPITGLNAVATFDLNKMIVDVEPFSFGTIRVQPAKIEITGLADTDQYIHIPLQISTPVADALRLVDHPPLGYAKALGIAPDDLQGKIDGSVDFRFPLLKNLLLKDLAIQVVANATGVGTTKLLPGMAVDQGNFALNLDTAGLNLTGQADLSKIPFQITWQELFSEQAGKPQRHVTVNGNINDNQWDNLGVTTFKGTKGPISVALDLTRPNKKKMLLTSTVDMTRAAVQVDMLDWKKPANSPAVLKLSAVAAAGQPVAVKSIELRGDHTHISGTAKLSADMMQLLSIDLPVFVVGRTNTALHLEQTFGDDGALQFDASGASFDVSGLTGGKGPEQADPRPKKYHVKVDHLYTSDDGEISAIELLATRDQQGWSAFSLHGLTDGNVPLDIELTPQDDGHRTLMIACNNFGKMMKGLGFTDTIKGGNLRVNAQSTAENPRLLEGQAKISAFTVEKLPALALLLNATSPFGFSGILTDSTDFSRFKSDFRLQDDTLTIVKAHAAGSAIGINIDGKVNTNTGNADLQGTLVPFSTFNSILNAIPLIGDLLTGGEDQGVLAVSYKIKGNLGQPDISVNPVSLLTPGFLRNLFFRDSSAEDYDADNDGTNQ